MTTPSFNFGNTEVLALMYAGGLICLICAALIWRRRVRLADEASAWPAVRGDVLHTEIIRHEDSDGDEFEPRIIYAYKVGGAYHSGHRIRIGPKVVREDEATAIAMLAPYQAGQKTMVRYDPERPERSVLDPRPAPFGLKGWLVFGLFLLGSAAYITLTLVVPRPW